MMKTFELTKETKTFLGRTLYRIKATISFGNIIKGELGGWVEKEENLSGNALVSGDARVYGDAWVSGDALVSGNAWVYGNARVSGNALVSGDARVSGDALVSPINIIGLYYSVTITDASIRIGCEYHSIDEWGNFSDEEIEKMDGYSAAEFWSANKEAIMSLAKAHKIKAEKAK